MELAAFDCIAYASSMWVLICDISRTVRHSFSIMSYDQQAHIILISDLFSSFAAVAFMHTNFGSDLFKN